MADYTIHVTTVDGVSKSRSFKRLKAARKFAERWVGKHPDIGSYYAVSQHGDAKVEVSGISVEALFAEEVVVPKECYCELLYNEDTGASGTCDYCRLPSTRAKVARRREQENAKRERAAEKVRKQDARAREMFAKTGKYPKGWLPF